MPERFASELTLPAEPEALPMARTFIEQLVTMAELDAAESEPVIDAAVEACANVIDHAYEPGEEDSFTVAGELDAASLRFGIRDHGLPIDAARESATDDSPARQSRHHGMAMIRKSVDSAEWISHGRDGKELRLVKRRPHASVHEHLEEGDHDRFHDDHEQVPLAPEQEYDIRPFQPEDAIGISRVIYRVYGNTYIHEDCYYPERLVALNATGELASVVAVTASGEVVGHYALERPGLTRVAERGIAVVSPAHRGRDLMGRMRTFIEEEARRLGLIGVYSVAVTKHTFSQRVNEAFGSDVCGIQLAGGPDNMQFKGFDAAAKPQRISWVVYFTYVDPPENAVAHAPKRHRGVLERIYTSLELPVIWHDEQTSPTLGHGQLTVTYNRGLNSAKIDVLHIGDDTAAEIRRATQDLFEVTGAEAVYLHLPLGDPATPGLLDAAEAEGYFFSALGPSFLPTGDALCLQRLAADLDFSQIEIANPFASELLDYISDDRDRVRAARVS